MAYPYKPSNSALLVQVRMADVSAPSTEWVVPGFNGRIRRINSVIAGAITVADSNITVSIGSTAVTGGTLVVSQSGSAAGDVDTATPTGANIFSATDAIKIVTDGGSTTTQPITFTLELEPV